MATPTDSSGWGSLLLFRQELAEAVAAERERAAHPVECPNDGEPLVSNSAGELRCPYDGWMPRASGL